MGAARRSLSAAPWGWQGRLGAADWLGGSHGLARLSLGYAQLQVALTQGLKWELFSDPLFLALWVDCIPDAPQGGHIQCVGS